MSDSLFLQFYSQRKSKIYNLLNGFSDTYDLCLRHGDMFWMQDEIDSANWYDFDRYAEKKLPIQRGTLYVSALDVNHLYQCWVWAKQYPDIRFVVGGPVATERSTGGTTWNPAYLRVDNPSAIPENLILTGRSVESWFGEPEFSGPWKLDVPEDIPEGSRIYFSYTLDNTCFWSRCIYCNIGLHATDCIRRRRQMDFEFRELPFNGTKLVRLNTGSITPKHIRELLPRLPTGNGFQYRTFMRAADPENQALKSALAACGDNIPDLVLGFGMEFPSERMWKFVDKGFGADEVMESLDICSDAGIRANGNFIVGWKNLNPGDVDELEAFMDRLPERSFKNIQLRWLFAHPYTAIHDQYTGKSVRFGPFYEGFSVDVDDPEQLALNRRAVDIIDRYAGIKKYRIDGLTGVRKRLDKGADPYSKRAS